MVRLSRFAAMLGKPAILKLPSASRVIVRWATVVVCKKGTF
jgi:hypothetical protein